MSNSKKAGKGDEESRVQAVKATPKNLDSQRLEASKSKKTGKGKDGNKVQAVKATRKSLDSQRLKASKCKQAGKGDEGNMLYLIDQAIDVTKKSPKPKGKVQEKAKEEMVQPSLEDESDDNGHESKLDSKRQARNKKKIDQESEVLGKTGARIKWTAYDVTCLWNGIRKYGNSWSEIRNKFLPLRSTDQVKDKGKRLLRSSGWKTGRTKSFCYKASEEAKEIARTTCNKRAIPNMESFVDMEDIDEGQ